MVRPLLERDRRAQGGRGDGLSLPDAAPEPVLALGGYLRAAACLGVGAEARLTRNVGDLDTEAARAALADEAAALERAAGVEARVLAVDLHPDYPSTWAGERLARERSGRVLAVQHHLAHAAATLAEHGRFPARGGASDPVERVGAIVLDGTGFGTDGTAWGAEWLVLDGELRWRRAAHGAALPLVGGERAVREPWRVVCAALVAAGAESLLPRLPLASAVAPERLAQVTALARQEGWPRASGAGRVFEAAGAMLGLGVENRTEGEAAIRFQALAERAIAGRTWDEVALVADELPTPELLTALAQRVLAGEPPARAAAEFHATFARLAGELAARVFAAQGHVDARGVVRTVALGGGCLVNRLLATALARELVRWGFEPLLPHRVPAGDGGLAYGQAVLATAAVARGVQPYEEGPHEEGPREEGGLRCASRSR